MAQKSHIIVLDSKHRINYANTNSNQCTLQFLPALTGIEKLELLSFSIPIVQYNIDNYNNTISISFGEVGAIATIPPGCYTYLNLPQALQTALNAVSGTNGTFTVTYDNLNYTLTIECTSQFAFNWGGTTNSAAQILGFNPGTLTPMGTSISSPNSINLSLPMYFYIQCPEMGRHVISTKDTDWATFVITTDGNSGDIMRFNIFSHYQCLEAYQLTSLSTVHFTLCNSGGYPLETFGTDWVMVLKAYYPDPTPLIPRHEEPITNPSPSMREIVGPAIGLANLIL